MKTGLLAGVLIITSANAFSQAGTLDSSFGVEGLAISSFFENLDQGRAMVIQPDDKIVVAGMTYSGTYDFALCRFNADGTPDNSFGVDGKVITDFSGYDEEGSALTIQPDGKLIVAGFSYDEPHASLDFALARYLTDGTLDDSFGNGGKVMTFFDGNAWAKAIAVQADGKIVAAGASNYLNGQQDFGIVRYLENGDLDLEFGEGGIVRTGFATNSEDNPMAIALQADGKIIVTGETRLESSFNYDFAIVRYNANGTLDDGFNDDGRIATNFGFNKDVASAVAIQADGKIIATGKVGTDFTADFGIARYSTSGYPDETFGEDGRVIVTTNGISKAIMLQPDNKILVAGGDLQFLIARYDSSGNADTTFGTGGLTHTTFTGDSFGNALGFQSDGKIILAGTSNGMLAAVRYGSGLPLDVALHLADPFALNVYPNPFAHEIKIEYNLPTACNVNTVLINAQGMVVKDLSEGIVQAPGFHSRKIVLGNEITHGIYYLHISCNDFSRVIRVLK